MWCATRFKLKSFSTGFYEGLRGDPPDYDKWAALPGVQVGRYLYCQGNLYERARLFGVWLRARGAAPTVKLMVGGRPDPRVEKLFLEATKGGLY